MSELKLRPTNTRKIPFTPQLSYNPLNLPKSYLLKVAVTLRKIQIHHRKTENDDYEIKDAEL